MPFGLDRPFGCAGIFQIFDEAGRRVDPQLAGCARRQRIASLRVAHHKSRVTIDRDTAAQQAVFAVRDRKQRLHFRTAIEAARLQPGRSAAAIEASALEWKAAKPEKRTELNVRPPDAAAMRPNISSPPITWLIRCWRISFAAASPSNCARHTTCAPPAIAAIAAALPNVPQNGTAPSSVASAASSPICRATSAAWPAIVC